MPEGERDPAAVKEERRHPRRDAACLLLILSSSGCLRSRPVLHGDDLALAVAECEVVVEEPSTELVRSHALVSVRQNLAEGGDAEVLGCHWISFLSFPSDTNNSA